MIRGVEPNRPPKAYFKLPHWPVYNPVISWVLFQRAEGYTHSQIDWETVRDAYNYTQRTMGS